MLGQCRRWEDGILCTMQQESSCFAYCKIRCWLEEVKMSDEVSANSQMQVLHFIFPLNEPAREWKLFHWGLCCLAGFCWRHVRLVFDREEKRQEQGEHNESDEDSNLNRKCLTRAVGAIIRLRPNRATPASVEIAKLDWPPINDAGPT
jgi:hypothetical protein